MEKAMKNISLQPRFKFNTIGLFTTDNKVTVDFYTKVFGYIFHLFAKQIIVYTSLRIFGKKFNGSCFHTRILRYIFLRSFSQ